MACLIYSEFEKHKLLCAYKVVTDVFHNVHHVVEYVHTNMYIRLHLKYLSGRVV